jgi:hypothetical protein
MYRVSWGSSVKSKSQSVSCCSWGMGTVREPRGRETSDIKMLPKDWQKHRKMARLCAPVNCELYKTVRTSLLVVTSPTPVYGHYQHVTILITLIIHRWNRNIEILLHVSMRLQHNYVRYEQEYEDSTVHTHTKKIIYSSRCVAPSKLVQVAPLYSRAIRFDSRWSID